MESSNQGREKRRVCVTGAGGFAASWLVKLLLSKGFIVHGTVRDPSDSKNAHLLKLENSENLQLFKANMIDYDDLAASIAGCEGVFHVASHVPQSRVRNPEMELVEPIVAGTRNVLKACSEAKVKRLIVVSSIGAITMVPNCPQATVMDEYCWSDTEYCRKLGGTLDWYCLAKTLAEKEALDHGEKNGLNVSSVCPSWILGPLLQQTVNASSMFLINFLKGGCETVSNKMCNIIDVRDLADALLLVYEKQEASSGRYICSAHSVKTRELVNILRSLYQNYTYPKDFNEDVEDRYLTSDKLKKLGWKFRPLKECLINSIESYQAAGLLDGKQNLVTL